MGAGCTDVAFPLAAIVCLSLDVTRGLVVLGYGLGYDSTPYAAGAPTGRFTNAINPATSLPFPPLAITACTGAGVSPIVVTTQYPHGVSSRTQACGGLSCIISGVGGNTAANNIDANPLSRTCGLPAGTLAVPTGTNTLALYGQNPVTGAIEALTGNGEYTSGGTITPAFGDGSILIGQDTIRENSSPPRLCLVPRSITTLPREASLPSRTRNAERRAEIQQRSIGTDVCVFDAHAWGAASPPDAANDFIAAEAIRECLRTSLVLLACGTSDTGGAVWDDEGVRKLQYIKSGHLLTSQITIKVPVLDNPIAGGLPFVPAGSLMRSTVQSDTGEVVATFDVTVTPA